MLLLVKTIHFSEAFLKAEGTIIVSTEKKVL